MIIMSTHWIEELDGFSTRMCCSNNSNLEDNIFGTFCLYSTVNDSTCHMHIYNIYIDIARYMSSCKLIMCIYFYLSINLSSVI